MTYLDRLRADLARPFGGWTTGLLTLGLAAVGPLVGWLTVSWLGPVWMAGWLFVHIIWGSAGYYPANMTGR